MGKRTREDWKVLIAQHAASEQSLAEFSRRHKLKRMTFIWWRKEFRRAARKAKEMQEDTQASSVPRIEPPVATRSAVPEVGPGPTTYPPKLRRSRPEWEQIISNWIDSGETAVAYAAQHDLKVNTLRWWKSELFGKKRRKTKSRVNPTYKTSGGPQAPFAPLTVPLVDLLAQQPTIAATELARHLQTSYQRVLRELRELEELGIVFRTGRGPGARWALG